MLTFAILSITMLPMAMNELGRMVILPSTFTGGPRYMQEKTQDALTYVKHYGRPDLSLLSRVIQSGLKSLLSYCQDKLPLTVTTLLPESSDRRLSS